MSTRSILCAVPFDCTRRVILTRPVHPPYTRPANPSSNARGNRARRAIRSSEVDARGDSFRTFMYPILVCPFVTCRGSELRLLPAHRNRRHECDNRRSIRDGIGHARDDLVIELDSQLVMTRQHFEPAIAPQRRMHSSCVSHSRLHLRFRTTRALSDRVRNDPASRTQRSLM